MRSLCLLGSTGSIGLSTLDIVRRNAERFRVDALVAGHNIDLLADQIREFKPRIAVTATESGRKNLTRRLAESGVPKSKCPELLFGPGAIVQAAVAPESDFVMSAIVGVAGLEATFESVRRRKTVGLANKEVLVTSGELVMNAAKNAGTAMIPVDSEHNGAHQCLRAGERSDVTRLILTASGGPFRDTPAGQLAAVTPAQALNHPTWRMGRRITIDSATMMNKGFEVVEAHWLFGLPAERIQVVVHPQSTVHAMVEYVDGSVIAQLSATDMRMPIQYALTYPEREAAPVPRLDWSQNRMMTFSAPDTSKFPCLRLAYDALRDGGSAPCTLNAADEIAVEAFLEERISFPQIAELVEETLNAMPSRTTGSIEEVLEIDREARAIARRLAAKRTERVTA